jgi:ligand-binding SRPBCC domain-containing protein
VNRLRLHTNVAAPPDVCYRIALTVPVQERSLARVKARAVGGVTERPLHLGDTVSWHARWLGLPWRMTTRIVSTRSHVEFVDEQIRGPFDHWYHVHRFTACDYGTSMEDDVTWSAPFGIAGRAAVGLGFGRFIANLLRDHNLRLTAEIESLRS